MSTVKELKELLEKERKEREQEKEARKKAEKEREQEREARKKAEKEREKAEKEREQEREAREKAEKERYNAINTNEKGSKLLNKRTIKRIMENGFPKHIRRNITASDSKHKICEYQQSSFKCSSNFKQLVETNQTKESSLLRNIVNNIDDDNYSFTTQNEYELQNFVHYILEDAIKLLGLENEIIFYRQKKIFELEPDFWVIRCKDNNNYIGSVEVKLDEDSFSNKAIVGQIYDYMVEWSYLFSKVESFGILITYDKVAAYFTEESKNLAETDTTDDANLQPPIIQPPVVPSVISQTIKPTKNIKLKRFLFRSEILDASNPFSFFELICSAILKMINCRKDHSKDHLRTKAIMKINKENQMFSNIEITTNQRFIDLSNESIDLKTVYVFKYLGGGGDGHCSLAYTIDGYPLAIKYLKIDKNLEEEGQLWLKIWDIHTKICTFVETRHLVMPYLKIISDKDIEKPDFLPLLKESCETFSSRGFKHNDLHFRHVAKLFVNEKKKFIFIDLSRVTKISDQKKACDEMYSTLLEEFKKHTPTPVPTPNLFPKISDRFVNQPVNQETPKK